MAKCINDVLEEALSSSDITSGAVSVSLTGFVVTGPNPDDSSQDDYVDEDGDLGSIDPQYTAFFTSHEDATQAINDLPDAEGLRVLPATLSFSIVDDAAPMKTGADVVSAAIDSVQKRAE